MRSAKALKDVVWDTWTCTLGWPVQGIWPECADGTDINSVCASKSRAFIATGDDFSKLKVFRYPCLTKGVRIYQCFRNLSASPLETLGQVGPRRRPLLAHHVRALYVR